MIEFIIFDMFIFLGKKYVKVKEKKTNEKDKNSITQLLIINKKVGSMVGETVKGNILPYSIPPCQTLIKI